MQFNFVSAKKLYAEIRFELDSYFAVGAMDDILFDLWLSRALDKLGVTVKKKSAVVIQIQNYKGVLPNDFSSVYDVWSCTTTRPKSVVDPTYIYYQEDYEFEDQCTDKCSYCRAGDETKCTCPEDYPDCKVVHRVTGTSVFSFTRQHRIVPGDIYTTELCNPSCPVLKANSEDTFQISDCHIYTTVKEGTINLYYYTKPVDKEGNLLVPENSYIHEYLFNLILFNSYKKLLSDTHDETYNQVRDKMMFYQRSMKDAYLNMDTRLKMPSEQKILKANQREKRRFNRLKRRYY